MAHIIQQIDIMGHILESKSKLNSSKKRESKDKLISKDEFKRLFNKESLKVMSSEQINDSRLKAYSPVF